MEDLLQEMRKTSAEEVANSPIITVTTNDWTAIDMDTKETILDQTEREELCNHLIDVGCANGQTPRVTGVDNAQIVCKN
jgi:hypothetical protein